MEAVNVFDLSEIVKLPWTSQNKCEDEMVFSHDHGGWPDPNHSILSQTAATRFGRVRAGADFSESSILGSLAPARPPCFSHLECWPCRRRTFA